MEGSRAVGGSSARCLVQGGQRVRTRQLVLLARGGCPVHRHPRGESLRRHWMQQLRLQGRAYVQVRSNTRTSMRTLFVATAVSIIIFHRFSVSMCPFDITLSDNFRDPALSS